MTDPNDLESASRRVASESAGAPADLQQRLELLERENARLRNRLGDVFGFDRPDFDVLQFQRTLQSYLLKIQMPVLLFSMLALATSFLLRLPRIMVLDGFPLFDIGGMYSGHPGIGVGVVAAGGLAIGVLAIG